MAKNEQREILSLKNIPEFEKSIELLICNPQKLSADQQAFLLACAILLIKQYEKDNRRRLCLELGYCIILKYSVSFEDYEPLYDFSVNLGTYPIANTILRKNKLNLTSISDLLVPNRIQTKYASNGLIQTLEQKKTKDALLSSNSIEMAFIAPTSYGKSSLIAEHIKVFPGKNIGIIVPTKSLLMQSYRSIRENSTGYRIITHDEMYDEEKKIPTIAVFTQERALRLLEKYPNFSFDALYIDEAHRLLEREPRAILLSRLIRIARVRNSNCKLVYLSPLVADSSNLGFEQQESVFEQRIRFNIKEAELFEYRTDGTAYQYNRFLDTFYHVGNYHNMMDYIFAQLKSKNMFYLRAPRKIEQFAKEMYATLPTIYDNPMIDEAIENLQKYIHPDFFAIKYLKKGLIYLHGKIPDNIKDYLEYKFREIPEIKILIANSVIMEGMNLPIDCLFILNVHSMTGKSLTNLIGRVNRLSEVFSSNDLSKLLPPVHFVNSDEYNRKNGKMANAIAKLRSNIFADKVKNPTLKNYDNSSLSDDEKQKDKEILQQEKLYFETAFSPIELFRQKMISLGLGNMCNLTDDFCKCILDRIESVRQMPNIQEINVLDRMYTILFKGTESNIVDLELARLSNERAISYYKHYFAIRNRSPKEQIDDQINYFLRCKENDNSIVYVGESYGEIPNPHSTDGKPTYVDLRSKGYADIVNLSIVRRKMEDDFVGYKMNMIFQLLYDYGVYSEEEYKQLVYGTVDETKLHLLKLGLSLSIITRLENDNQFVNVGIDEFGNPFGNDDFYQYKIQQDDFYRFELSKYFG